MVIPKEILIMYKKILLSLGTALCLSAGSAHASEISDAYDYMRPIFLQTPEITDFTLCVRGACETFDTRNLKRSFLDPADDSEISDRKGGTPELLYQRPQSNEPGKAVAGAVSEIVSAIGGTVGTGGRVVVDFETRKDGTVKVHVEASFGTGSGASAGASGGGGGGNGQAHQN